MRSTLVVTALLATALIVTALLAESLPMRSPASDLVSVGPQILAAYKALREKPRQWRDVPKTQEFSERLDYLDGQPDLPAKEFQLYIALRAISSEIGVTSLPKQSITSKRVRAMFPESVRRKWSPAAQCLWDEAFFIPDSGMGKAMKGEIARLRRDEANTETLEALIIGDGELTTTKHTVKERAAIGYSIVDRELRFAETHPSDITASVGAAGLLNLATWDAQSRNEPVREDLVRRVFALEARTLANVNRLLNDNKREIKSFTYLRERLKKR